MINQTVLSRWYTLPKTNVAPENGWLEDEIACWEGLFSRDMLVSQRVVDLTLQLTHGGKSAAFARPDDGMFLPHFPAGLAMHYQDMLGSSEGGLLEVVLVNSFGQKNMDPQELNKLGVSKNRGTPKWMIYNGNPC